MTLALLAIAGVVFAVYFALFVRTMKTLSQEENSRYLASAWPPSWQYVLGGLLLLTLWFSSTRSLRAIVAIVLIVLVAWATLSQQMRLERLGFDAKFTRRLSRVSVLAGVAMLLFLASMVLQAE